MPNLMIVEYDNFDCLPSGNICPYCLAVNDVNGGSSESIDDHTFNFWCEYCGKEFKILISDGKI
jgi:hypothetical protein